MPPIPSEQTKQDAVRILKEVALRFPRAYSNCHANDNTHPERLDFTVIGLRELKRYSTLFGLNGKRGNPNDPSSDAFAYGNGSDVLVIDFLIGAGEQGNDINRIVWNDVTLPGVPGLHINPAKFNTSVKYTVNTRLGASMFPLVKLYQAYRPKLVSNCSWLEKYEFDYVRALGVLGGDNIDGFDPWYEMGYNVNAPEFPQLVREATSFLKNFNLRVEWTVIGSRPQIPSLSDLERMIDIFASVDQGNVEFYCICNEYGVFNKMTISEMRHCARRLRPLTGKNISLSSPNTTHMGGSLQNLHDEIRHMYDGLPEANAITPHWNRRNEPPFIPGCNLGPYGTRLEVYNNEWFGPGSSGTSSSDPRVIGNCFKQSIEAGEKGYKLHTSAGVWFGKLHPHWPNSPDNIYDEPNADQIARTLCAIKYNVSIVQPPDGGGGGEMPLPDRGRVMNFLNWLHDYYKAPEGLMRPEGLVFDNCSPNVRCDTEGIGAWVFDIYLNMVTRGKTDDEARAEVIKQIRHSHEWQEKHPGEIP